jgi:hypothetical protein
MKHDVIKILCFPLIKMVIFILKEWIGMEVNKIIQSNNPDIDTLKCPKCGVIWCSHGYYNFDEGGWVYEDAYCPSGCRTWFSGSPVQGKTIPRD